MKNSSKILLILVVLVFMGSCSYISVWNSLNSKYHQVKGGASLYSAALNIATEKIKGVWTMSEQYLNHESKTFKDVAAARSGFLIAKDKFQSLSGKKDIDTSALTKQADMAKSKLSDFQRSAMLGINVQIEQYPQLKGAETTKQAMRTMEEGVNEIKTSLDDWIFAVKAYNQYRGSFFPSLFGGFMGKFPIEIEYYEGQKKSLDIDSLNPEK